ncbi:MAG TPA: peptidylprolyl isomerase [Xanthomonadaceae bacterium]|nr:peptidylprolyl isomerase [Xanthomonadaceae bacterium]
MKVAENTVVRFHYALSEGGQALESSFGREPLSALIGASGIIPGLEAALMGRAVGDRFEVTVPPEKAYGERHDQLVQRVPRKRFSGSGHLQPGVQIMIETNQGRRMATVAKVGVSVVDLDLNHPMAGKTLTFDIEVVDVREASTEEIEHGHAHGPGGHEH